MPSMNKMQFTQAIIEKGSFNDDEQSFVAWASKPVVDRDNEVIAADGWDLDNYEKNKVLLWAHDYTKPPIGKVLWIKPQKNGLKFKPQFANTEMAKEVYSLYRDEFMTSFSVGFIPKHWVDKDDDGEEEEDSMSFFHSGLRTFTGVELLEISCVPVPACPDAVVERYAKGQIKTKGLQQAIAAVLKGVIPFRHYPLAEEDAAWDGPKEVAAAEVSGLKIMCAWYDSESPDVKGSYKLPHHKADGYNTVWRGVSAAMGALLGARGGVNVPDDDRRGVYNHLSRHYKEFDKEPPEFKEYDDAELKELFPVDFEEKSKPDDAIAEVPDEEAAAAEKDVMETPQGKVEGGWEAEEIDKRNPVEVLRIEGLSKAKDNIVPVSTELWNNIMDWLDDSTAEKVQEAVGAEEPADSENMIEFTDEEFDLMVEQARRIEQQQSMIAALQHGIAELTAKLIVLRGGSA